MARSNKSSAYMVQRKLAIQGVWIRSQQGFYPFASEKQPSFLQYLLDSNKRYETTISLGTQTATGDREGRLLQNARTFIDRGRVERCLGRFRGNTSNAIDVFGDQERRSAAL